MASTSAGNASRFRRAKLLRRAQIAGVPRQPAAAALGARDDDFDAVAREHFDGGGVDVGIEHLLRAAGEQRHARAAFAAARDVTSRPRCAGGTSSGTRSSIGRRTRGISGRESFADASRATPPARKRAGYGIVCAASKRRSRSPSERVELCLRPARGRG